MEITSIYLIAVLLALIEGLTEFIPVSSTGHLILFGNIIDFTSKKAASFEIFIQLGAILAVVIIYKEKFLGLIPFQEQRQPFFKAILRGKINPSGLHILLAIVPICILGFIFHKTIKIYLFSPVTVAAALIVGGVMMIIVEYLPIQYKVKQVEEITYKQALLIGLGQCFAIWPGMSRSGSTIVTGLLLGIRHKPVADFSFIIAVPVMVAAVGYDLLKSWQYLDINDLSYFSLGFLIAFIVAWASIKWFLSVLTKIRLIPFGIYRIVVGCLSLWVFLK